MKYIKVLIHADENREPVFTAVDASTGESIDGVQDIRVEPVMKDGKNTFTYQAVVTLLVPVIDTEQQIIDATQEEK